MFQMKPIRERDRHTQEVQRHLRQNQTNPHFHNIPRMPTSELYGPAALFHNQWMKNIVFERANGNFVTCQGIQSKKCWTYIMFTDPDLNHTQTKDIKLSKCHLPNMLMLSAPVLVLLPAVWS